MRSDAGVETCKQRGVGRLHKAAFGGVVAVVQAHADDLGGVGHGCQELHRVQVHHRLLRHGKGCCIQRGTALADQVIHVARVAGLVVGGAAPCGGGCIPHSPAMVPVRLKTNQLHLFSW
ncbi:hypothetical protein D3C71_1734970 [compost metagenome]